MVTLLRILIALLALCAVAHAQADTSAAQVVPGYFSTSGCNPGVSPCFIPYGGGGSGPGSTVSTTVMTYQGAITLAANTSTAVSTLTLSNGTAFPAAMGKMVVINTGTSAANICWFGGTCSASGGSEPLAAGTSDTVNLGSATTSPTAFSTVGTTLAVHN